MDDQFFHQFLLLLIDQDEPSGIYDQLLSSLIVSNFCLWYSMKPLINCWEPDRCCVVGVSPSRDEFHDEHPRTESINRDEASLRGAVFKTTLGASIGSKRLLLVQKTASVSSRFLLTVGIDPYKKVAFEIVCEKNQSFVLRELYIEPINCTKHSWSSFFHANSQYRIAQRDHGSEEACVSFFWCRTSNGLVIP